MIRETKSFTLTATGQPRVQVGFAQARHRNASSFARAGSKPRFTSSKLRQRSGASRSGMCCRGIFMRSLFAMALGTGTRSLLTAITRQRFLFGIAIHRVALHQNLEVHVVRVELRTVDACELAFVLD
jgi:hypothetical protein